MMPDSDNLVLDGPPHGRSALARAIAGIYERRGELATADLTSAQRPAGARWSWRRTARAGSGRGPIRRRQPNASVKRRF